METTYTVFLILDSDQILKRYPRDEDPKAKSHHYLQRTNRFGIAVGTCCQSAVVALIRLEVVWGWKIEKLKTDDRYSLHYIGYQPREEDLVQSSN